MSKKKNSVNVNLGTSSILLIFFVLSLVSFAVLSLSSALSDKKLTDRTIEKNLEYYEACNLVQPQLEEYDQKCISAYNASSSEQAYISTLGETSVISVQVNETQDLEVIVKPQYPHSSDDCFYSIVSWKLVEAREPAIDFSIPVFK